MKQLDNIANMLFDLDLNEVIEDMIEFKTK